MGKDLREKNSTGKDFREEAWFLYKMVPHFTLRKYDVNKVFFRKKIGFDNSFDVRKCLQQIEMPNYLHVCA